MYESGGRNPFNKQEQNQGEDRARRTMISAIVVNYNGAKFLSECLHSLCEQTYPDLEVIVVDNASTDGSDEIVRGYAPQVRLVQTGANLGYGGGINAGMKVATGEAIFALNNDIVLDRTCVAHLATALQGSPRTGMLAPRMLLPDGRVNSTGLCISRSGAAWNRQMGHSDPGPDIPGNEVLGPCGGAALYRRTMLDEIGWFDETFFMYMEDVDIAVRACLAGWKCRYVPAATVIHANGATAGWGSDLAVYYGNRNIVWYTLRDFPTRLLITSLPWIVGRTVGVMIYYALQGRGLLAVRSKVDALRGIGRILSERRQVIRSAPYHEFARFVKIWADGEARYTGSES
ncbi:MAG: glycosyltransferase family 2 protein [Methanoregulaceae archaeon]